MELDNSFQEFFEKIALGALPEGRITSAWTRLHAHLTQAYAIPADQVFLQGSYANDTAVKPARPIDTYDIDVVAVCASPEDTADQALQRLEEKLAADGDYQHRIQRKKPCVRLLYAPDPSGGFHIDIVPARPALSAPLEIPRRADHWKDNDPVGYRRWCVSQGAQFVRTVRMLKRWRDVHQGQRRGVKSVVLQVLVANAMHPTARDASSVTQVFRAIADRLTPYAESAPAVRHPLLNEDLAESWPPNEYRAFRGHVLKAAQEAEGASADDDESASHERWRRVFGGDFPPFRGPSRTLPTPPPGSGGRRQQPPRRERYG